MSSMAFPVTLSGGVRRVVTGVDSRGKAVVVEDAVISGDERAFPLWSCDEPPVMGRPTPPAPLWWPAPGGVRVTLSTRRPDRLAAAERAATQAWPDINDAAGFHASCSADVIIILAGRIWCELDDGVEVELNAGDCLIQNGTRHRWHNHGDEWPMMAAIIVGATSAA